MDEVDAYRREQGLVVVGKLTEVKVELVDGA